MRIKVEDLGASLHPREAVVRVDTLEGPVELVVDRLSLRGETIEVGNPLGRHEDYFLFELPSETSSGAWRVWVPAGLVSEAAQEAAE